MIIIVVFDYDTQELHGRVVDDDLILTDVRIRDKLTQSRTVTYVATTIIKFKLVIVLCMVERKCVDYKVVSI